MPLRSCVVSYVDLRGIRHSVDVEAETLYEAAVLGLQRLKVDPWGESPGPSTPLDVEVRQPGSRHAITLTQVERWLASASQTPQDVARKTKLKMLLMRGA